MELVDSIERRAREMKQQGDYVEAIRLRLLLEQTLDPADLDRHARIYNWLAYLGVHIRQFAEAERAARLSLDCYFRLNRPPDARLATYTFMLSAVLASSGRYDEAVTNGEHAIHLFAATEHDADFIAQRRADVERMRKHRTGLYLSRT